VDPVTQQKLNELKKRKRRLEEALRAVGGYNLDIECELDEIEEEIESLLNTPGDSDLRS